MIWQLLLLAILAPCINAVAQRYILFNRYNPNTPTYVLDESEVDFTKPIKIIVHPYLFTDCQVCLEIKDEYLRKEDCNVMIFDWSDNFGEYDKTVTIIRQLGKLSGDQLYALFSSFDKIHLIGLGFGAHMAGIAGKQLFKNSNGTVKIARITGLDPVLPLFNSTSTKGRLSETDADVVDVYHCDGGQIGFADSIGTVDFFINGGIAPQPGCADANVSHIEYMYNPKKSLCSHTECFYYFLRTISSNGTIATKCDSWDNYKIGTCDGNGQVVFGEDLSPGARGNYYLNISEVVENT